MTTQVIFRIDEKTKEQAMKKAHHSGLSFATVLKLATYAFVEDKFTISLNQVEPFNLQTRKKLNKIQKDLSLRKNLSPRFKSAKDAMGYLMK
ncbi:MAG: Uncharacterized protein G01um101418_129 [Parcubacteria group bacterium Gr01-1014_18]|nr:MAG: Uncharacterized protein Greene041636_433 [Parcubacteria group bacterium Greene0416_36]TSC81456.1 MAG: Uncharacterized protein G01um101418_129 [Parcubacteria group bacterium Gr01-1014_18]TSC99054.1 MAG: Uncharacterized protein Greene101420_410 [Parcubacteria group bacterium Greene1014_20]TSD07265.1 MAG: Uncharacterized protein Greene07142_281 [Parcubacteria group bacterium Greene0714_2]